MKVLLDHVARRQLLRNGGAPLGPWATIFSSCRFARCTAPTGMPVQPKLRRTLRPAAGNGATLARLLCLLSRALGAVNLLLLALMMQS
jgi:hypothetical protein